MIKNKLITKCIYISLFICSLFVYQNDFVIPKAEAGLRQRARKILDPDHIDDLMRKVATRRRWKSLRNEIQDAAREQADIQDIRPGGFLDPRIIERLEDSLPPRARRKLLVDRLNEMAEQLKTNKKQLKTSYTELAQQLDINDIDHPAVRKLKKEIIDLETKQILLRREGMKTSGKAMKGFFSK